MGYFDYQQGLIRRHLDQDGAWDSHLDHCRKYILRAVDLFNPEKVTILGSGWLLDLPLSEILEKTKKVILIDIIHPPDVISQVSAFKDVEIVEADVTGGLVEELWAALSGIHLVKRKISLSEIVVPEFKPGFDPGLIISLNLLTQLENLPLEYIRKQAKVEDNDLVGFRKEIQKKHLDFLIKFKSVMITDVEEIYSDRKAKTKTTPTLLAGIPAGNYREEWIWDFDLNGSDYYNTTSVMKVVAVTFGL